MHRIAKCLALLLVVILAAGCDLASIQLIVLLDMDGSFQSTEQNVAQLAVDLTENEDFDEHKDDIHSVIAAGFVFRVQNNLPTEANGKVYFSAEPIFPPTREMIESEGTLILTGLTLPADGYLDIDFKESRDLQVKQNQAAFHKQIESGMLYLYGIADTTEFDITIDQLTVVVILTVGT